MFRRIKAKEKHFQMIELMRKLFSRQKRTFYTEILKRVAKSLPYKKENVEMELFQT